MQTLAGWGRFFCPRAVESPGKLLRRSHRHDLLREGRHIGLSTTYRKSESTGTSSTSAHGRRVILMVKYASPKYWGTRAATFTVLHVVVVSRGSCSPCVAQHEQDTAIRVRYPCPTFGINYPIDSFVLTLEFVSGALGDDALHNTFRAAEHYGQNQRSPQEQGQEPRPLRWWGHFVIRLVPVQRVRSSTLALFSYSRKQYRQATNRKYTEYCVRLLSVCFNGGLLFWKEIYQ